MDVPNGALSTRQSISICMTGELSKARLYVQFCETNRPTPGLEMVMTLCKEQLNTADGLLVPHNGRTAA